MTLIRVKHFHEHFRERQLSEWLNLGKKTLDHSYDKEVKCSVTAFDFSLSLSQNDCNDQTMISLKHSRGSFTSAWDVKLLWVSQNTKKISILPNETSILLS